MPTMEEIPGGDAPPLDRCAQCSASGVPLLACDDPDVSSKGPTSSKPRFCNKCMIGKKVRVFWPVDESWYTGTVQEYDGNTGEHLLCYQDGDTEWVKIGENTPGAVSVGPGTLPMDPSHSTIEPLPPLEMDSFKGEDPGISIPGDATAGLPDRLRQGEMPGFSGQYPPGSFPPGARPPGAMQFGSSMMQPPMGFPMYPPPYGGPMYPPPYSGPNSPLGGADGEDKSPGSDSSGLYKRKAGPRAWSKDEDALLLSIVQKMKMPIKWSVVAQSLRERTGKQCRERYVNHLNPRLKTSDWNPVEDTAIFHLYGSMGSHWAKMSKLIPGRTDNGIKNRFHNLRRQYEREDEHRLRLSSAKDFGNDIRLDRMRSAPENLKNKNEELWDIRKGIGVLAAQSILGNIGNNRSSNYFGDFRDATEGDMCARCGCLVPSVQTGAQICTKTGWCQSCTRLPAHLSENILRECLNLRRAEGEDRRKIVESWEEFFAGGESKNKDIAKKEASEMKETAIQGTDSV